MYSTILPYGHFNPTIRPVAQLPTPPSPPPSLRNIVDRLNKTPTRIRSTRSTANLRSCSTSSLFDNHSNTGAPTNESQQHSSSSSDTTTTSTIPATPDNHPLSQAIIRALDTTPLNTTLPSHCISQCKVQVQVHIHIHPRPIAPTFPQREQLKRKRDSSEDEVMLDTCEISDRQAKKTKLSHDSGMAGGGQGHGRRERGRGKNGENRREVCGMRRSLRSGREMRVRKSSGGGWGR